MKIQENIPLAPYTTFKIGGPAKFFCEADGEEKIVDAFKFAREKNLHVFALGGGSNVLVSDKGFDGLVIKIKLSAWRFDLHHGDRISILTSGAGCPLSKIVKESVKAGLTGLEWAAGIPGTIGGAVRGNAGAYGGNMSDSVELVRCLEIPNPNLQIPNKFQLPITNYQLRDCKFDYRNSVFKQNPNLIILSVNLKLRKGDRDESEKKIKEILKMRKEKQPMEFPSAGSFFKNPIVKNRKLIGEFEIDTGKKAKDNKIPAGYFIDRVGLRGKKVGGAMFSEKHANFIVNTGNATADNVLTLVAMAKTRVRDKYGIQFHEEVQMVGF